MLTPPENLVCSHLSAVIVYVCGTDTEVYFSVSATPSQEVVLDVEVKQAFNPRGQFNFSAWWKVTR